MNTMKRKLDWRIGILIVVVCLVIGILVNLAIGKAYGAVEDPAPTTYPVCDNCSEVRTKEQGVNKFKNDVLGRNPGALKYTAKAKDVILDKLMNEQSKQFEATGAWPLGGPLAKTRAEMWDKFTRQDTCGYKAMPGTGTFAVWTCNGKTAPFPDTDADWERDDVDAIICGTLLGISIKGVLAKSAGGPWVWIGLGAGAAACIWQDNLGNWAEQN